MSLTVSETNLSSTPRPYRVIDLIDERGMLFGKILGHLGYDVIEIENTGGDHSRRNGPFCPDIPDPEKSLYWFAYNTNKISSPLDIESSEGQPTNDTLPGLNNNSSCSVI